MSKQEIHCMDEARLHAYVDGRLDAAAAAAEVADWLALHPDDAARVLAWRSQRSALQGLHAELLDEPLPTDMLQSLRRGERRLSLAANAPHWRWQALAAVAVLGLGLSLGWGARAWLAPEAAPLAAARLAPAVPGFVRDAGIAHAVYLPERRHPVEVGAEQQAHLVQWLSKRLGEPLRVPHLEAQGWRLMGGRLLPAGEAVDEGPQQARAQFMYEGEGGQRLTLYVSVLGPGRGQDVPSAFQFSEPAAGQSRRSFFWVEGRLGYALTGELPREALARLGEQVYQQLQPARPGS